jgi:porphobilinogen synthase
MLLLEPALHTLDILVRLRQATTAPLVPSSVSGKHTQLTHLGQLTPPEDSDVLTEQLTMLKRSGAAMILTYAAKAVRLLAEPAATPVQRDRSADGA